MSTTSWDLPLRNIAPTSYGSYYEPFLGSGAIFFNFARNHTSYLSDTIEPLINCYQQVRDRPGPLAQIAQGWQVSKDEYYRVRSLDYRDKPLQSASQFIYLNKVCFNGLYRENRMGQFNVPYGKPKTANVVDIKDLLTTSERLRTDVHIEAADFEDALARCEAGDFVYLDPPYSYKSSSKTFTDYNSKIFSWDDQRRLAALFADLSARGVFVIQTNANQPSIRDLYRGFPAFELNRYSSISGRATGRGMSPEILLLSSSMNLRQAA